MGLLPAAWTTHTTSPSRLARASTVFVPPPSTARTSGPSPAAGANLPASGRRSRPAAIFALYAGADPVDEILLDLDVVSDRVPETVATHVAAHVEKCSRHVLPGDAHRLRSDVEPDAMDGVQHFLGPTVVENRSDVDAEAHRLAMNELLSCFVFQRIEEEVIDPLDLPRIPAVAMERRAPAQAVDQHLDALFGEIMDVVGIGDDVLDLLHRLPADFRVVGPFGFAFADGSGVFPIQHAGVIAHDVADARVVEVARRGADHVVVDIDCFRHGPADVAHHAVDPDAGALTP